MPANKVTKLPRLRKKTRRRKRATKPRRAGSTRPRLVPFLPLASWRKNCNGLLPILRNRPSKVVATRTAKGMTAVWTKIAQSHVTKNGGRL